MERDFDEKTTCLLCGEPMSRKWDEYTPYYECDCPSAKHNRFIREQIQELKEKILPNKYRVAKKVILEKI